MLTRIDHVGLAVRDLDAAIAFYRDTFDVRSVHEEVNEEQGVREAMLAVGDSGSCIQLLAPLRPDSPIARFLDRSGEGVQQVAYTRRRRRRRLRDAAGARGPPALRRAAGAVRPARWSTSSTPRTRWAS